MSRDIIIALPFCAGHANIGQDCAVVVSVRDSLAYARSLLRTKGKYCHGCGPLHGTSTISNRDAPKFVQQCATCSREILSGLRYHCPTCADFDQCPECLANPKVPRHPHPLKPIPVSGQQPELTEAQRRERQRSIQLHMTLLQHAATCNSTKCPSANCTKMKGLLKHGAQCQIKATGGCNVCKRIWALLQIHARQCKLKNCMVPNCMAIRERVRQLKKQQQAMDDRRRIEMNRAYRGKR